MKQLTSGTHEIIPLEGDKVLVPGGWYAIDQISYKELDVPFSVVPPKGKVKSGKKLSPNVIEALKKYIAEAWARAKQKSDEAKAKRAERKADKMADKEVDKKVAKAEKTAKRATRVANAADKFADAAKRTADATERAANETVRQAKAQERKNEAEERAQEAAEKMRELKRKKRQAKEDAKDKAKADKTARKAKKKADKAATKTEQYEPEEEKQTRKPVNGGAGLGGKVKSTRQVEESKIKGFLKTALKIAGIVALVAVAGPIATTLLTSQLGVTAALSATTALLINKQIQQRQGGQTEAQ